MLSWGKWKRKRGKEFVTTEFNFQRLHVLVSYWVLEFLWLIPEYSSVFRFLGRIFFYALFLMSTTGMTEMVFQYCIIRQSMIEAMTLSRKGIFPWRNSLVNLIKSFMKNFIFSALQVTWFCPKKHNIYFCLYVNFFQGFCPIEYKPFLMVFNLPSYNLRE